MPKRRLFDQYKRRALPVVTVLILLGTIVVMGLGFALMLLFGPLAAAPVVVGMLWLMIEYGLLFGNQGLRRSVAAKLRGYGRRVDTGDDRFVGLAWPCHFDSIDRRMAETDDDVGFLRITPAGIEFWGDGVEFTVPADDIADVRLRRHSDAFAFWPRVEVDIRSGDPMETVVFDSRNLARHGQCRRDNRRLYRELRSLVRTDVEQVRLEALLTEAEAERLLDA